MNTPPFGRAPIAAGPAWNEDGSIKEIWARWFTALGENVSQASGNGEVLSIAELLNRAKGATAESVTITALGLLTGGYNRPQVDAGIVIPSPAARVPEIPTSALFQRPYTKPLPQILVCTQPTFPTLSLLAPIFIYVSDYAHLIYWDGAAATFAGDNPGRVDGFYVNPGVGWRLCDGATVNYLNADGTITAATLPDLTSAANLAAYLKFGSPASLIPNAAIAAILTMNPYTPTGANSAPAFTGTAIPLTTASVSGAGTIVIATVGGSNVTVTPAGSVSAPAFTGNAATLTGTNSATAEPRNLVLRPYFRL